MKNEKHVDVSDAELGEQREMRMIHVFIKESLD